MQREVLKMPQEVAKVQLKPASIVMMKSYYKEWSVHNVLNFGEVTACNGMIRDFRIRSSFDVQGGPKLTCTQKTKKHDGVLALNR